MKEDLLCIILIMEKYQQHLKKTMMTNEDWFKKYDEHLPSFRWFIHKYFVTQVWVDLCKAREEEDRAEMCRIMNVIWFELPDNKFNIITNPVGWSEFLSLVED